MSLIQDEEAIYLQLIQDSLLLIWEKVLPETIKIEPSPIAHRISPRAYFAEGFLNDEIVSVMEVMIENCHKILLEYEEKFGYTKAMVFEPKLLELIKNKMMEVSIVCNS